MIIVIDGEIPAKKNSNKFNLKTKRVYKDRRYTDWEGWAMWLVLAQKGNVPLIDKPCRITMTFVHGDLKRRDSDNAAASILDLLKDCKVIEDDNWKIVKELVIKNEYQKGNPSCKVEIESL